MILLLLCISSVTGAMKLPTRDNYTITMSRMFVEHLDKGFFKYFNTYNRYINRRTKHVVVNITTLKDLEADSWFELKFFQMRSNTFHSAAPMNVAMRVKDCLDSGFAGIRNVLENSNLTRPYLPIKKGSYVFFHREEYLDGTTAVPYMSSGEYKILFKLHNKLDNILDVALYSNAREKLKMTKKGRSRFT